MLRTVAATRYVTPLREGGSLPAVVEADDDGLYVVKFRAAGQGLKALVAEVIVGELARTLGLATPELVLAQVDPELGRTEPDAEINDLVCASAGLNLGVDFLPGALDFDAAHPQPLDPRRAAEIVWLDALMTNVDRTARNPNLLVWHGRVWLIDHGAALYQHHSERDLVPRAREPFPLIRDHVLLAQADALPEADARLAAALDERALTAALALVPDEWLGEDPAAARGRYLRYLSLRLQAPRPFVQEALDARNG